MPIALLFALILLPLPAHGRGSDAGEEEWPHAFDYLEYRSPQEPILLAGGTCPLKRRTKKRVAPPPKRRTSPPKRRTSTPKRSTSIPRRGPSFPELGPPPPKHSASIPQRRTFPDWYSPKIKKHLEQLKYPKEKTTPRFSGKVAAITDGDRIVVNKGGGGYRIRLDGIDCPEKGQSYWKEARKFTSDLVLGEKVKVALVGRDRYGWQLGVIKLSDGRVLNEELVKNGLARWYREYSDNETLSGYETEARGKKVGIWSGEELMPPWDFRRLVEY